MCLSLAKLQSIAPAQAEHEHSGNEFLLPKLQLLLKPKTTHFCNLFISTTDVNVTKQMLFRFVQELNKTFGKSTATLDVHQLTEQK